MRETNISVCVTVYNGSSFLEDQLASITAQLQDGDELIIVDDSSTDNSIEIIEDINFPNTILVRNPHNVGVNTSLELAIYLASKSMVFLSDQDDIWIEGRVNRMLKELESSNKRILFSNNIAINSNGIEIETPFIDLLKNDSDRKYNNLISIFKGRAGYYGCTLCFYSDQKRLILPIPKFVESLDLWIAKIGILSSNLINYENYTLYRRVHNNLSLTPRPMYKKLYSRIVFLLSIVFILSRFVVVGKKT